MRPVSVGTILTESIKTTVFKVPTGYYALWNLSYAVNNSGNNKYIDILWYDASTGVEMSVIYHYVLSPTQYIRLDGAAYVVLEEGDEVRALSEAGSVMSVINTFDLYRNKG
jgi:hypothetical protein